MNPYITLTQLCAIGFLHTRQHFPTRPKNLFNQNKNDKNLLTEHFLARRQERYRCGKNALDNQPKTHLNRAFYSSPSP